MAMTSMTLMAEDHGVLAKKGRLSHLDAQRLPMNSMTFLKGISSGKD